MIDDSGTGKLKQDDLGKPQYVQKNEELSKDEIDSIADLISDDEPQTNPSVDLDDTGRFTR